MNSTISSVITGTGSYIPTRRIPNKAFLNRTFLDCYGKPFQRDNKEIIQKFEEITGIKERRYVTDDKVASDIAHLAAEKALESADLDKESLDYIIVAHNFGDVRADNKKVDMVPSLASRVKQKLGIGNPECLAYDLPFGCPGWLQGLIQGHYYLQSGDARRILVIGTETLSRVCDPHDRDSMIYADGAGASILEARKSKNECGIIAHAARTDAQPQAYYLTMDRSYNPEKDDTLYLKMEGRKLYQYALTNVPGVVAKSLEKAGIGIHEVDKILIHQANAKMDHAIVERLFKQYGLGKVPVEIMPMTISWLGNTSVATIPTLLDLVQRGELDGHSIQSGDTLVFASVGAGMNINSVVYRAD